MNMCRQCVERGVKIRHHQGRCDPFSFHIGNHKEQRIGPKPHKIVIISAHHQRRRVSDTNIKTFEGG